MIWVASEVRGPGADSGQIGSAPGKKAAPAPYTQTELWKSVFFIQTFMDRIVFINLSELMYNNTRKWLFFFD